MRRPPIIAAALAVILAGAYAAYWFYVAGMARQAILDWAEARRVEGYAAGWDRLDVSGFPFVLRVRLDRPVLGQSRDAPAWEAQMPALVGDAAPWAPHRWRWAAAEGGRLKIAPSETRPPLTIEIAALDGAVAPAAAPDPPGIGVAIHGEKVTIEADARLTIEDAALRVILPARSRAEHQDVWTRAALELARLRLPVAVAPLGDTLDKIAAEIAVKGAVPAGPRRAALAQWRDAGGTVELERLQLLWGALAGAAQGTLALDPAMQPMGAGTATIGGYGEILDALAAAGAMRPGDLMLARLGLGLFAKTGPDGKPQITAPVTVQNSTLSIAQFKIARLPRFTWD